MIDPDVPVPQWRLRDDGRRRVEALANAPWVAGLERIITSAETKAIETGEILAAAAGVDIEIRSATDEIDRSSTGYLPHDEHDAQADRLFAAPRASANGWERAIDAQARMVAALDDVLIGDDEVAVVGHGGVGTLLWCHLAGVDIARRHDQSFGGHVYAFDLVTRIVDGPWRPFEDAD
ncbi:MAG: histidine phosphatase family protein [Actinomycetota bacterium]